MTRQTGATAAMDTALLEARETFFAESRELLESMEDILLRLEEDPGDEETLNALFRVAHTIKGSAGLFDLHRIVGFTHILESVLDRARAGQLLIEGEITALLLRCRDHIATLIDEIVIDDLPLERQQFSCANGDALTAGLMAALGAPAATDTQAAAPRGLTTEKPAEGTRMTRWQIRAGFGRDTFRHGMDPVAVMRFLATLGEAHAIEAGLAPLPERGEYDPEDCLTRFSVMLDSDCSREELEAAFDFVRDDCEFAIEAMPGQLDADIQRIHDLPDVALPLGEILLQSGNVVPEALAAGLALQFGQPPDSRPQLGQILLKNDAVSEPVLGAALARQQHGREPIAHESSFIRVRADKLDRLINLVGELVVGCAGVTLRAQRNGDGDLYESAESLSSLVELIRDDAMQLRMVPIADTFRRFNRVVRDTSHELGKQIVLQIEGADNELDKSMVEKLTDPLTHLVRNAIDHGIEHPDQRAAAGKPAEGHLKLSARHESGCFVIEVSDDGAGLNRERILAKALERGLAQVGRDYSDAEVWQFIFEPGFSTASALTNLSGRGVGMDVVRRSIQSLRGSIEVESRAGAGTRITLRMPLTLAIIDGFIVGVGRAQYVVPLDMVVECVELTLGEQSALHQRHYINLRGEVLPFVRLRDAFDLQPAESDARESVVVVQFGKQRVGLVVDALLGEFQTVIRPLSRLFQRLRCIAGSTILGTGEVALILDVAALIERSSRDEQTQLATLI
ncbi:chemotaxis protein CheA [Viridibacterium curvum]|uniref:Chemotaxis protein CheA n=1 Tax=Viridibacterium curvum TaxID=1101404 RepID=A0ABP9QMF7_9RHOO